MYIPTPGLKLKNIPCLYLNRKKLEYVDFYKYLSYCVSPGTDEDDIERQFNYKGKLVHYKFL